jgi:cytochrome c peroxidase
MGRDDNRPASVSLFDACPCSDPPIRTQRRTKSQQNPLPFSVIPVYNQRVWRPLVRRFVLTAAVLFTALVVGAHIADAHTPRDKKKVPGPSGLKRPTPIRVKQEIGRRLFFDPNLSNPIGKSCASCHSPEAGFADPDRTRVTSIGSVAGRTAFRNAPTVSYVMFTPPFTYLDAEDEFGGGFFYDGRADSLKSQIREPLLDPLEMHNSDIESVVRAIAASDVSVIFRSAYGPKSLDLDKPDESIAFIADAIGAFLAGPDVSPFSSKFDAWLRGKAELTEQELRGYMLFNGQACCSECHPSTTMEDDPGPLFTTFEYDNLGIPKDWDAPYLKLDQHLNPHGDNFVDEGLARVIRDLNPERAERERGKFKVPTLRNIDLTAPYGHNGYFKSLKDIVRFYNTRDLPEAGWEPPEVRANVNTVELGNLGLTSEQEDDVVAFLKTLTDGYKPEPTRTASNTSKAQAK